MGILVFAHCSECGKAFAKRNGSLKVHCSVECKKKAADKKKPLYVRVCAYPRCNTEFSTSRKDKTYCDKSCKKAHEAERAQKEIKFRKQVCLYEQCRKPFMANKKQRYCCADHARAQKLLNDRRRYDQQNISD